ncbi:hypothetical protein PJP14_29710, partial [Mycobacterium kansasii]
SGHMKKDCQISKSINKNANSYSTEVNTAKSSEEVNASDMLTALKSGYFNEKWIMDTGALYHMTLHRN